MDEWHQKFAVDLGSDSPGGTALDAATRLEIAFGRARASVAYALEFAIAHRVPATGSVTGDDVWFRLGEARARVTLNRREGMLVVSQPVSQALDAAPAVGAARAVSAAPAVGSAPAAAPAVEDPRLVACLVWDEGRRSLVEVRRAAHDADAPPPGTDDTVPAGGSVVSVDLDMLIRSAIDAVVADWRARSGKRLSAPPPRFEDEPTKA
jgi:hypothetical protein